MSLSDRVSRGTARQRRAAFAVGLWSLASVNFLDLSGALRLDLSASSVGWLSLVVLLAPLTLADDMLEELNGMALVVLATGVWGVGLLMAAVLENPGVGEHFLMNATLLGMTSLAILQAAAVPAFLAPLGILLIRGFHWLADYRYLRSTTPEERILGSDQSADR